MTDIVGIDPTGLFLVEGESVTLAEVFSDSSDTLREGIYFGSKTRSPTDPDADWATHFSVRVGVRQRVVGNWDVFFYPVYGSPYDTQSPAGKAKPYYTRVQIDVQVGTTTFQADVAASASIIGNGHGIPPTVVEYNNDTQSVVSSTEGHTLAFQSTTRIEEDPNRTGFSDDGEFTIRYDHTVDVEGREEFYAMASWPCTWVDKDGTFNRGDDPGKGKQTAGFCCGEEGPYARNENLGSDVYQIEHVGTQSVDKKQWDNSWDDVPRETRGESGISPFCGNAVSRHNAGTNIFRDFGYAWLLKKQVTIQLQMWPSPVTPHTTNVYMYNYDTSAMRGKGRIMVSLTWLWLALKLLREVRDDELDPEVAELEAAAGLRTTEILNLLKVDYQNDSWAETNGGGSYYAWWMLGHYMQSLVVIQEAIVQLTGTVDAIVDAMMVTFAEWIHDHTYEWANGSPHPIAPTFTYTGSAAGWFMAYHEEIANPENSDATTGISPKLIICYEWAKLNGIRNGTKQDAIISQFSTVNYKWKLGTTSTRQSGAATLNMALGLDGGSQVINYEGSKTLALALGVYANGKTTGLAVRVRTGATISITNVKSVGTTISAGPQI